MARPTDAVLKTLELLRVKITYDTQSMAVTYACIISKLMWRELLLTTTTQEEGGYKRKRQLMPHKDRHTVESMHEEEGRPKPKIRILLQLRSQPSGKLSNCSDQQTKPR